MPVAFWYEYPQMPADDRRIANFFTILKTYKILFDFQVHVGLRRWNSTAKSVSLEDVMMEIHEISAHDGFVDSWAEATKKRVASAYLTILRKVGMLNHQDILMPLSCDNFDYYLTHGESWFLEACLLQPYQIDNIKKTLL